MKRKQLLSLALSVSLAVSNLTPISVFAADMDVETVALAEEEAVDATSEEELDAEIDAEDIVSDEEMDVEDILLEEEGAAEEAAEEDEIILDDASVYADAAEDQIMLTSLEESEESGWKAQAQEITVGKKIAVSLKDGENAFVKFTPKESGKYVFYTEGDGDTFGLLHDEEGELDEEDYSFDDDYNEGNFRLAADLKAGSTYYLIAYEYNHNAARFSIVVEKTMSDGWHGDYYYLDGEKQCNTTVNIDGIIYVFDENGLVTEKISVEKADGLIKVGDTYIYIEDGELVKGSARVIGKYEYYFDWDGYAVISRVHEVWQEDADDYVYYCFDKDGHRIKSQGLHTVGYNPYDDNRPIIYYVNKNGYAEMGWQTIGGKKYYFSYDGAYVSTRVGFSDDDDNEFECCFAPDGHLYADEWYYPYGNKDEGYYYSDKDGRIAYGLTNINGKTYYFNPCRVENERIAIGNCIYHFGPDGASIEADKVDLTGKKDGFNTVGSDTYYLKNGKIVVDDFVTVSGKKYYFDDYGKLYKDFYLYVYDYESGESNEYHVASDGHIYTGWYTRWGSKYYSDENGIVHRGRTNVDGDYYYFDDEMKTDYTIIEGGMYSYYGSDGKETVHKSIGQVSGEYKAPDGKTYYIDEYGDSVSDSMITIGSDIYYYNYDGVKVTDSIEYFSNDDDEYGGYYFDKDGKLVRNRLVEYGGAQYYAGPDGIFVNGLKEIDGNLYFFDESMLKDSAIASGGKVYQIDESGKATTMKNLQDGFLFANNEILYIDKDKAKTGSVEIGGVEYYFDEYGRIMKNRVTEKDDVHKYVNQYGVVPKGWSTDKYGFLHYTNKDGSVPDEGIAEINGKKYYFFSSGEAATDMAVLDNGTLYYCGKDGVIASDSIVLAKQKDGILTFHGKKYYIQNGGFADGTQMVKDGDKTYCFSDGWYLSNTSINYEDAIYFTDEDGALVKPGAGNQWVTGPGGIKAHADQNGAITSGLITVGGKEYFFSEEGVYRFENIIPYVYEKQMILCARDTGEVLKKWDLTKLSNGEQTYVDKKYGEMSFYVNDHNVFYGAKNDSWYSPLKVKDDAVRRGTNIYYVYDTNGKQVQSGWYTCKSTDNTYYVQKNGKACIGTQTIDGKKYYFEDDGCLLRNGEFNEWDYNNHREVTYRTDANGVVVGQVSREPQSITVKAEASTISVGKKTTVTVTGNKGTLSYRSSNTKVATVDSKGNITAVGVGEAVITVTSAQTTKYDAASKNITIKVTPAAASKVTVANTATGVEVSWNAVNGAESYLVYRGKTKVATVKAGTVLSYLDKGAKTNGTKYTYKIVASAKTGNGASSASVSTIFVSRPSVTLKNSASKTMRVSWKKNTKATGYELQYCLKEDFSSGVKKVAISSAKTVKKDIKKLKKKSTYYVRLRAYKKDGSKKYYSEWSAVKKVTIKK